MTNRMYFKETAEVTTSITLNTQGRGTVRATNGKGVWQTSLDLPVVLTFEGPTHVHVHDRDQLDSVLTDQGYFRFEVE